MLSHERFEDRGRLIAAMPCGAWLRGRCHCGGSDGGDGDGDGGRVGIAVL